MLTQDAIVQLILRYIGGSKIQPTNKLSVGGARVTIQATTLQGIANKLAALGANADEIRKNVLQNPKAQLIAQAKANVGSLKERINLL